MLEHLSISEQIGAWEEFLGHPCWAAIQKIAEQQMRVREDEVLGNPYTPAHELLKGERLGIGLVVSLPGSIMDSLEVDVSMEQRGSEDVA